MSKQRHSGGLAQQAWKRLKVAVPVALLFFAPGLLVLFIFLFLPIFGAFVLSLTNFDLYALASPESVSFIGLDNYAALLSDPRFWTSLKNTCYFVFVGGPLTIGVSLAAALLLNSRHAKFTRLFQTIYFLPVVSTLVAVAIVWRYIYHPQFGLLNAALDPLGVAPIDWLGDPTWSMPAIILLSVWKNFGFNMIIFLAGLQTIPQKLYDAALMDGANAWQRFRHVTLPMLGPTTFFVAVVTVLGYFQLFAEPYVMTRGGPLDSTLSIVLYMYEEGFRWWNIGYASSIAFLFFLIVVISTYIPFWLRKALRSPSQREGKR